MIRSGLSGFPGIFRWSREMDGSQQRTDQKHQNVNLHGIT
jgi:hypothetical protein